MTSGSQRLMAWIAVVATLVLLVAVNALVGLVPLRFDLTADKSYTLSPGTVTLLGNLKAPVQARLYVGSSEGVTPPFLKVYATRIEDLLDEMAAASNGKLEVRVLDPQPDSDAGDSARIDGIEPQTLPSGESITLGLSFTSLDAKTAIPFVAPSRDRLLEYDIARGISLVGRERKPVLGVMTALPVFGQPMMMMGGAGPRPWVLAEELRRDFDVRPVPMVSSEIPAEIGVLFVIHPVGITPEAEYAIDQFLMRGGRVVAFVDPLSVVETGGGPMPQGSSSNLPTLLPSWGIGYDASQSVADLTFEGRTQQGRNPWLLSLTPQALDATDVLTADTTDLLLAMAGTFTVNATEGLHATTLARTSTDSQIIDPFAARLAPDRIAANFAASGREMALAVRLSGKFRTAFPGGPPPGPDGSKPEGTPIQKSENETTVILVGDVDMLQDPLAVEEIRGLFPGGRMFMPINGNLAFAQSAAEQLSGDPALIAVRGRGINNRPFTVVRAMQAEAEKKFQTTIRDLEASLQETQSRLAEIEQGKQEGQKFILSTEQQKEILRFRETEANVRKQLKQTRRELRSDIDALETGLKWLNIAAVPALVVVSGIGFGLWRRSRSRAR